MEFVEHFARDPHGALRPLRPDGWTYHASSNTLNAQEVTATGIAGSLNVEFLEVIQSSGDLNSNITDTTSEFALGWAVGHTYGRMNVDAGEGRHTFEMNANGIYLNHPNASEQVVEIDGQAHIRLLSVPTKEAAAHLQMDDATFQEALRPLHEQLVNDEPVIRPLAQAMWKASRTPHHTSDLFVDQSFQSLALYMLSVARGNDWGKHQFADEDGKSLGARLTEDGPRFSTKTQARLIDFIQDRLGDPLRLADLAQVAGMSNSTFSRAFKATMGEPAWTYVRRQRIEAAAHLLKTTQHSIAEVAYRTGFSSQQHLTKAFSDHFGAPPGQLRSEMNGPRGDRMTNG